MAEGALYDPPLAARAMCQARGDMIEAILFPVVAVQAPFRTHPHSIFSIHINRSDRIVGQTTGIKRIMMIICPLVVLPIPTVQTGKATDP